MSMQDLLRQSQRSPFRKAHSKHPLSRKKPNCATTPTHQVAQARQSRCPSPSETSRRFCQEPAHGQAPKRPSISINTIRMEVSLNKMTTIMALELSDPC